MYLYYYNETDSYRWGHMSSIDLLHWRQHPDALTELRFLHSGSLLHRTEAITVVSA